MKTWRLLDTGALPGALNMGMDMAILALRESGKSPPTLRFYHWSPPAVSLGYFQKETAIDMAACRRLGIDVVRRATGGGAVLHENDLTYSIVAGVKDGMPHSVAEAYRLLSEGLLAGFRGLGVEPESGHGDAGPTESDICFTRFAAGDLLYQGKKFMGNAQTWKRSTLLQHGSIMLESHAETWAAIFHSAMDADEDLIEKIAARTTSLSDIMNREMDAALVKTSLTEGMARALTVTFQPGEPSPEEWDMAREMALRLTNGSFSRVTDTNRPIDQKVRL